MKKLIAALVLVAAGSLAYGQGTVQFSNGAFTKISTDITGSLAPTSTVPGAWSFGLFYGIGQSTSLTLLTTQFGVNSTVTTGVIASPADGKTALTLVPLPGTSGNEADVWLQFAGWSGSFGTDWQGAKTGGYFGETPVTLGPALGATAGPGAVIWQLASGTNPNNLKAFVITVPEPATMALTGLGVAAMLIFRRRK